MSVKGVGKGNKQPEDVELLQKIASKQGGGTSSITSAISAQTTALQNSDFMLRVSMGSISGYSAVHVSGHAIDGLQTTATDIWDRADATTTQQIWLAPTAARIHAIVSSSASDDGSPVGVGARTLRVWGLTSWSSAEVTEDVTLNGTTPVDTSNSYVMINQMQVLTAGATNINVGTITATAATDSTVTAAILPGIGKTQMAIYGLPSTKTLYINRLFFGVNKAGTTTPVADMSLLVNPAPSSQITYYSDYVVGTSQDGTSWMERVHSPPLAIAGPAIVKLQADSQVADTNGHGGFDGILVTN